MFYATLLVASLVACESYSPSPNAAFVGQRQKSLNRRDLLSFVASTSVASTLFPKSASAAPPALTEFGDPSFSLQVPKDWTFSEQALPDRRKLLLWQESPETFLFVAYTPLRDDYTSLSSFGSVDQVAEQTILPKSNLGLEDDVDAVMLSATSSKSAYVFDYRHGVPSPNGGQVATHFRTIFTMLPSPIANSPSNLVTITAQTPESKYKDLQSTMDAVIQSYQPAKK